MSEQPPGPVFARSGLAAISDFAHPDWRDLFEDLEAAQADFLARDGQFRSPRYLWPRDPLHNWSRAWEYPYAFYHLRTLRHGWAGNSPPQAVDVGSGLTFFPFAVARLGFEVICTDIDPAAEESVQRAIPVVAHGPGRVSFRRTDGQHLPFADGEADVTYCISVLEHIPQCEKMVAEFARTLKPGGLLLLTIDIDLRGDLELGAEKHRAVLRELGKYFDYLAPDVTIHPVDMLTSLTGPYAERTLTGWPRRFFLLKQNVIKPLLGRKPRPLAPFLLAVQGFAMLRRSTLTPPTETDSRSLH